jgi:hypothetical protein
LITFHANPAAPTLMNAGRAMKAAWRCAYGKRMLGQPWRISKVSKTRFTLLYPAVSSPSEIFQIHLNYSKLF